MKLDTFLNTDNISSLLNQARHAISNGDDVLASEKLQQILQYEPQQIESLTLLAYIQQSQNQFELALQTINIALNHNQHDDYAYYVKGKILERSDRLSEAITCYQQALALHNCSKNHFALIYAEMNSADTAEKQLKALQSHDAYLYKYPNDGYAYQNRSTILQSLGCYQLALADVNRCIQLMPEYALAYCNKSFILNILGEYLQGWELYEWRWKTELSTFKRPPWPIPMWQGEEIGAAKLLIYAEQGFGDNIQFMRYALLAQERGMNIVVVNHKPLENLLNYNLNLRGIQTSPNGKSIAGLQYYVSMMSLPHYFATTLDNIPYPTRYLSPEPEHIKIWSSRIPPSHPLKIGVVWSGSFKHSRNNHRSIPLAIFSTLFSYPAEFHCLQKEINEADQHYLKQYQNLFFWSAYLNDFSDTAALIAQLDLVITVDTAVAHLAAAMGKPTWIIITHHPDFRWLLERKDSPWYENVTLFRQPLSHQWDTIFAQIHTLLTLQHSTFIQQREL